MKLRRRLPPLREATIIHDGDALIFKVPTKMTMEQVAGLRSAILDRLGRMDVEILIISGDVDLEVLRRERLTP